MNQRPESKRLQAFRLDGVTPPDGVGYEDLAEFGASFSSSMSEINRAGLEAQRRRQLTPERQKAWRQLRSAEKRLVLDYLHIQTDPSVFGGEATDTIPGVPPLERPPLDIPEIPLPSEEEILQALGPVPPREPAKISPGEPPPLAPDLWALLEDLITEGPAKAPSLPLPTSFLDHASGALPREKPKQ